MFLFLKKIRGLLWVVGICATALFGGTHQSFAIERVLDLTSSIEIVENSSVRVIERIEYDFDTNGGHSIERVIPLSLVGEAGEKREITVDILSVTDEGARAYVWKEEVRDDKMNISIEDTFSDSNTYVITYEVHGAILRLDDRAEFSWGVVGGGWTVPVSTAQATVKIPASLEGGEEGGRDVLSLACQLIKEGNSSDCFGEVQDTIALFSSSHTIAPGEEMLISIHFPRDQVHAVSAQIENAQVWFSKYLYAVGAFVALALLALYLWWKRRSTGALKSS